MGGGVGMLVAAGIPERVAGLIVIDTYPHPEMTEGSRRIAAWISSCAESGTWFDPAIARQFRDMLEAGSERRLDLWPMWEAIECPALVVRGGHSDVLTANGAAEMIARQPRAELVTVPGVSHPIPFQKPRDLAALFRAFAEGPVS
jgi:pimeloyl-ACP methyl ester carboxylesterase